MTVLGEMYGPLEGAKTPKGGPGRDGLCAGRLAAGADHRLY